MRASRAKQQQQPNKMSRLKSSLGRSAPMVVCCREKRGGKQCDDKAFWKVVIIFHRIFKPSNSKRNCYYDYNVTVIAFVAPNFTVLCSWALFFLLYFLSLMLCVRLESPSAIVEAKPTLKNYHRAKIVNL